MAEISRVTLFGKLNPVAYKTVESATVFCKLRGNPFVEIEHWVSQIIQGQDNDWTRILSRTSVDVGVLATDVTAALDRLPRGANAISDLSDLIGLAIERGWVYGTLMFGETGVRTGHVLLGMLKTRELRNTLLAISRQFERIRPDELAEQFAAWTLSLIHI